MYFLYSLVLTILSIVLLPYFVYQAIRHGKYLSSIKERLGWLPYSPSDPERDTIWLHAVSVGEFNAARPLIAGLRKALPGFSIVVTTTTLTGQRLALQHAAGLADAVFYFPFDWRFAVRRALSHVNPSVVVVLETELWPNFLRECRRRNVLTMLVNGRISNRSFERYKRVRWFMARVLSDLSALLMQSVEDANRVRSLGAPSRRVTVCGNLKYDIPISDHQPQELLRDRSNEAQPAVKGEEPNQENAASSCQFDHLNPGSSKLPSANPRAPSLGRLIIAGSTARGEEQSLLAAFKRLRRQPAFRDTQLLIAPRHPERFDEVAELISRSGFTGVRRTESAQIPVRGLDASAALATRGATASENTSEARFPDIILLDTIGELPALYALASVVFVGGSLFPFGGHNILEAAVHAKPIIVGPHTDNFRKIVSDFIRAGAIVQLQSDRGQIEELVQQLTLLLADHELATSIGERGRALVAANRGATDFAISAICSLFKSRVLTSETPSISKHGNGD
jgi:3-deoxy-D-manno-octulosonic-acid transferase